MRMGFWTARSRSGGGYRTNRRPASSDDRHVRYLIYFSIGEPIRRGQNFRRKFSILFSQFYHYARIVIGNRGPYDLYRILS